MPLVRVDDDRGRPLTFPRPPQRVVSLVPSDTFTVAALGCAGALVGRTDWCIAPEDVVAKLPSVGGTKDPRLDDICDLSPDLVIANQEENTRGDLEKLAQRGVRVYVGFPKRVADGLRHTAKLARIFGVDGDAAVRDLVKRGYDAVRDAEAHPPSVRPRVFCPIWLDPLMTVNAETFVSDVLALAGAENVFAARARRYPLAADLRGAPAMDAEGRDTRYPRVSWEEVAERAPDLAVLPDEPYAFTDEDEALFRAKLFTEREGRVVRVRGQDVTWYGAWSVGAIARVRAALASR